MRLPGGIELVGRSYSEAPPAAARVESFVDVIDPEPLEAISYAELPSGPTMDPSGASYGMDGDSRYEDVYDGGPDINPKLTGRQKFLTFEEMRTTDCVVRSCLWMNKLPIRSAVWKFVPAGADPVDLHVADCCAWQFGMAKIVDDGLWDGQLDLTWPKSLEQALELLDWGKMWEELVWSEETVPWTDADGDVHPIRTIIRMAPRYPATVSRINRDQRTGEIITLEQDVPGSRPIPGEKLLHYEMDTNGMSMLRPMYGPWKIKKGLMIGGAVGFDRHSSGTPVVWYPQNGGPQAKRTAEQIGRQYRAHERGYLALEGPRDQSTGAGWWVDILNGAQTLADPTGFIRLQNEEMTTAAVQMFSRLGTTSTGSRAVGEVLADPYYLAVRAIALDVAHERMKRAVRRFVDVNFGPQVAMPRLMVSKIQAKNVQVLSAAIADLAAAGLYFTDPETQNSLRDQLDLDHLPEDFQEVTAQTAVVPLREGDGLPTPPAGD